MSSVRLADSHPADGATRRRAAPATPGRRLESLIPFEYVAILPALLATVAMIVVPLLYSFGISFYRYILTDPLNVRVVGLADYARAFAVPSFVSSLKTTVIYAVGTVAVQFILGM